MRIEMLGPSGTGKTTILDAVQANWADKIIFPDTIELFLKQTPDREVSKALNPMFSGNTALSQDYLSYALGAVAQTNMLYEQKCVVVGAIMTNILRHVFADLTSRAGKVVIHDELLLHRGFSFLHFAENFKEAARIYYEKVPAPDVAVIFRAPVEVILERVRRRGGKRNWHKGLDSEGEKQAVQRCLAISDVAAQTLAGRGVDVRIIDTSGTLAESANQLEEIIREFVKDEKTGGESEAPRQLKERIIGSCRSFRKKDGRHYPVTQDVAYCAFSTPNFTIHRHESQRDSAIRFAQFGLNKSTLRGKRVLDLGSNVGAMLFQASNYGITEGLGIEYDGDKVAIAREIAQLSQLDKLTFRQGDIDALDSAELGQFDVTFALAIEAHVKNPDHLYELLAEVTGETLYFEGNGTCNVQEAVESLRKAGFSTVKYLGVCSDDVVRNNNCRPLLRASK